MAQGHSYKLRYFPARARGEPIRYLLALAGVAFEDERIPKDQWPAVKGSMPFGKVPVLEEDGKVAHQTRAICRYLAKEAKLAGDDHWEALQVDAAVDTIEDLRDAARSYFRDEDPDSKLKKKAPLLQDTLPFYLGRFDAQVADNGGYLVNGKLTWADVYFAAQVETLSVMVGADSIVADYPNLKALHDKVHAIPSIAAWVAKRPKTAF